MASTLGVLVYYLSLVSTGPQAQAQVLPVLCGAGEFAFLFIFCWGDGRHRSPVEQLQQETTPGRGMDGGRPPSFMRGSLPSGLRSYFQNGLGWTAGLTLFFGFHGYNKRWSKL